MNEKNNFIAQHQAGLSYLVVGAFFGLKFLQIFGYGAEGFEANDLKEIVMVVVLFWFMRERGAKPEDTIPAIPPGTVITTPATTTVTTASAPAIATVVTPAPGGLPNETPRQDP